jgi:chemotaxis protein MotB
VIARRRAARALFPVNVWPPMVDALTLVLATFVLLVVVAAIAQRGLLQRVRERDAELARLRDEKARIERRLRALAPGSRLEIDEGRVILQGEVLFDSGSDALRPDGLAFLARLAPGLASLVAAEPDQLVLVAGHTDDRPIRSERFPSNWELSTARAVAVARALVAAGLPPGRVIAAGLGEWHPRGDNATDEGRARNRRIELQVLPASEAAAR